MTIETYSIEGHPWHPTDTPWGSEADYVNKTTGKPMESCRDDVILRYLIDGDTRPLGLLMKLGYAPGQAVLQYLADMFLAEDGTEEKCPFSLKSKRRNGRPGPFPNPEIVWRDFLLSENVKRQMEDGGKYEFDAVLKVAAMLPKGQIAYQTVRDAYDERHPRKRKKPKGDN